ncbi:hypothetical protein RHOSPDRAFT_33712 [Rhodotorula sp. JG-1b]|nr:hypothetical protein RHOSPDRAFT_33712 [Rhodotorula sp. JG-1b]
MADPFKLGNKSFSAKEDPADEEAAAILPNRSAAYTLLQEYDLAIADGKLAAERCPRWAKTQVRLAGAYSRKHAFALADQAWGLAIDYAETDEERERYEDLREQAAAAGTRSNEQNGSEPGIHPARSSEVWWFKSAKKRENGPSSKSANAVFAVSCYAWEKCNEAWAGIDRSVYRGQGGQVVTHPFSNLELCNLVETILTDQRSFHLPPNMEDVSPRTGTTALTAARCEPDVVPIGHAVIIYGRIICAFLQSVNGRHGNAAENYRFIMEVHEAGRVKWEDEHLDIKGHVFGRTMIRSVKMEYMRCLVAGHRAAKTNSAKRMFALEKIEAAADEVLRDHFDNIYWYFLDQHDARFRIAFDHLPRWEALGALGYVNYARLLDSFRGFSEGDVIFGDCEAAKKMAEYYDAARALMPNDFYLKRIFSYPYFGPMPKDFEQRNVSRYLSKGAVHIPSTLVIRPVPTVRCFEGQDSKEYVSDKMWEGLPEDVGLLDAITQADASTMGDRHLVEALTRLTTS